MVHDSVLHAGDWHMVRFLTLAPVYRGINIRAENGCPRAHGVTNVEVHVYTILDGSEFRELTSYFLLESDSDSFPRVFRDLAGDSAF